MRQKRLRKIGNALFAGLCVLASPTAGADWLRLLDSGSDDVGHYIDLENVRQTGPMAIYRQVEVLHHGPASQGLSSTLTLYEYDCMNAGFRLLKTTGFSRPWAQGPSVVLPASNHAVQWLPLSLQPFGQQAFYLLCPNGQEP